MVVAVFEGAVKRNDKLSEMYIGHKRITQHSALKSSDLRTDLFSLILFGNDRSQGARPPSQSNLFFIFMQFSQILYPKQGHEMLHKRRNFLQFFLKNYFQYVIIALFDGRRTSASLQPLTRQTESRISCSFTVVFLPDYPPSLRENSLYYFTFCFHRNFLVMLSFFSFCFSFFFQ